MRRVSANWGFEVRKRVAGCAAALCSLTLFAAQPWNKDPSKWKVEDARHILLDSPWAQAANASFGPELSPDDIAPPPLPGAAEAGIAGSKPNSGSNWDGGPGRDTSGRTPTLEVTVRWDSALPVREAILKLPASDRVEGDLYTAAQAAKDYIITVTGLVPAGRYASAGTLQTTSSSSSDDNDPGWKVQDPEPLLEGVMGTSRLTPRDGAPIRPEDVKLDAATGALHLFFPRSAAISASAKDVTFFTQFGSMHVTRKFRPGDMIYAGRLEL